MKCGFCDHDATRTCLKCGRFACETHSGDRLVYEEGGKYLRVVVRRVCDACTPDQKRMQADADFRDQFWPVFVLVAVVFGPFLVAIAWSLKPPR